MEELKNKILLKKYKIIKRIGKGAFGSVFLGKNINKKEYVAIKLELKEQNDIILEREAYILHILRGLGIPQIISYGHNTKYNILIQELLGKSLDKILHEKNYKLSLKDSCMVGIQILDRLEYIHNKNIIHRDIKADNFLIGLKKNEIIYIIDFGLAKQFRSKKTGKHVKYCINKKWSGTSRFASANTLRGIEPSRRDDMESFCYLLLYLMKGSLPWDKLNENSEINEILMIYQMKQYMPANIMFKELPSQMTDFYKYCKNLNFEQKPNYSYLRRLLVNILENIGEKNDLYFSWIINISLNKSKSGTIKKPRKLSKINENIYKLKTKFYKSTNNSKKQKKQNININSKRFVKLKVSNSSEKINKENSNNLELKNHILGYCNIIKRKYFKSQSPNIKKVLTKNEKIRNKINEKNNNIIIDLTDFIESKKASESKSYKTKLFNFRLNEKKKLFDNQKENFNPLTERKTTKHHNNNINNNIKKISRINPIIKTETYSFNELLSLKMKSNNLNKNGKNKIYIDKNAISSELSKKKNKLKLFEINENNLYKKKKNIYSNSFTKELNLINNNNKKNNGLNIIYPRRQKTTFILNNHKSKKIKENGSNIYNKKILNIKTALINGNNKSTNIIKHKMTDNDFSKFQKKKYEFKRLIIDRNIYINQNINNSMNINRLYINNEYKF